MADLTLLCEMCDGVAPLETFPPNLNGYHNPLRCPTCGSTKNEYNRIHSGWISAIMSGDRKGPVTHEDVVAELEARRGRATPGA